MNIISRKEARAAGLKYYFTGRPCNRGMIARRTVSDKKCECEAHRAHRAASAHRRYMQNRVYRLAKQRRYGAENRDKISAYSRKHYAEHKAEYVARARKNVLANPERVRATARRWARNHPEKLAAQTRKRQAIKQNATPPWYGEFDDLVLKEAYALVRERESQTGIRWHVDHIIPLRALMACGLHVAANIQVIPAILNWRKGNRMPQEGISYGS